MAFVPGGRAPARRRPLRDTPSPDRANPTVGAARGAPARRLRSWAASLPGRRIAAAAVATALLSACAAPISSASKPPSPATVADAPGADHIVHVVRRGWHAGLIVERAALLRAGLPAEAADFPAAAFLEFGWGDRRYYMAPDPTPGMALRAALTPTRAALHVEPRAHPPAGATPDTLAVPLSDADFARLAHALSETFERRPGETATPLAPGQRPGARFYAATGRFHLLNTCNTWIARTLAAAGVAIDPSGTATAGDLMRRLRAAGASDIGPRRASRAAGAPSPPPDPPQRMRALHGRFGAGEGLPVVGAHLREPGPNGGAGAGAV